MEYSENNAPPPSQSSLQPQELKVRNVFLILLSFLFLGMLLTAVVTQLLSNVAGWSDTVLSGQVTADSPAEDIWRVRFLAGLNQILVIMMPGLLTLFSLRKQIIKSVGMQEAPGWNNILWACAFMIISTPLVLYVFEWNKMIPMPDSLKAMADQANETIKAIMNMTTTNELVVNLLLIAVIPAFGEELLFRGIIQRQLMRRWSPWVAILVTGALFSLFHFQMDGFIPRWMLGIVLGWLYWQTGNFWVVVAAHFFNNGIQVVAQYFYAKQITDIDLEQDVHIPFYAALISLGLVLLAVRYNPLEKSSS